LVPGSWFLVGKSKPRFSRVSRVSRAEAGASSEKQKLGKQKAEIGISSSFLVLGSWLERKVPFFLVFAIFAFFCGNWASEAVRQRTKAEIRITEA